LTLVREWEEETEKLATHAKRKTNKTLEDSLAKWSFFFGFALFKNREDIRYPNAKRCLFFLKRGQGAKKIFSWIQN
jgi:hypothetical protein